MADRHEATIPAIVDTSRLPIDIFMTIFEFLCPAPPSRWIHELDGNTRAEELISRVHHREYKVAMQTMFDVSKTCSWARGFMERYLHRYVVLSTGARLVDFAAAVHGRFQCGDDKERGEKLVGYVRGLYCLVDMTEPRDLMGWFTVEKRLCVWKKSLKGVRKESDELDPDLEHQGIPVTSGEWSTELQGVDVTLNNTEEESQVLGDEDKAYRRFLRTYLAPHDPCATYEGDSRPDPLEFGENMGKGNLYNLFLKTFYALPNVTDLLCSGYCIQRAAGFSPTMWKTTPSLECLDAAAMEDATGPTAPSVLYFGLGDLQDWGDGPWLAGNTGEG